MSFEWALEGRFWWKWQFSSLHSSFNYPSLGNTWVRRRPRRYEQIHGIFYFNVGSTQKAKFAGWLNGNIWTYFLIPPTCLCLRNTAPSLPSGCVQMSGKRTVSGTFCGPGAQRGQSERAFGLDLGKTRRRQLWGSHVWGECSSKINQQGKRPGDKNRASSYIYSMP